MLNFWSCLPFPPVPASPEFIADCIAFAKAQKQEKPRSLLSKAYPDVIIDPATGEITLPQSSVLTLPSPLSEMEARFYYAGLPSGPTLVARSSTTPWEAPTGPEANWKLKELRPIDDHHPLKDAWKGRLGDEICDLVKSMAVKFNSIDVIRIRIDGKYPAPGIIWIGVKPKSLSGDDGAIVVSKCRELLVGKYDLADVEVEIRESEGTRHG